ncbi:hypothetical protein [Microbacterium oxydans]|uniref:hypothetical protein n=1 Tax=Microbacterium oxydans TaxID=82380 RepID=UPI0024AE3763|nr:hypothetical protein [Microbacterium oxydans]
MSLLAFADAVDIGGGRGRLAAPAAASLARVDAAFRSSFGRAADINEAWRSPEQADKNYRAYVSYLAGRGPWAPIAYPAATSIHCLGYAVDTDDTSTEQMRIWNEHGWFWTVYRNGKLVERWHLEYFPERDKRRNDPAPAGGKTTAAAITTLEEPAMRTIRWNGKHVFTFGEEKVSHQDVPVDAINAAIIHNPDQKYLELDDAGLTTALKTFGVPWSALDACMRGLAYDISGAVGGRYWSRAVEQKIDTSQLAQTIAGLQKTAASVPAVEG